MNFYDKMHELVRSFKDTNEYKEFITLKNDIKKDEATYKLLKDFKTCQQKQQIEYLNTGKLNDNIQGDLENMYSIAIQNEQIKKLLECEMRLNLLLADVQKILGDGVKEIIEY